MNSPYFRTPHAHGHFPSIPRLRLPLLLVTIHPATDPFHAQGNLQLLLALLPLRFQRDRQPPSLPPSSSSTTRGWSSPSPPPLASPSLGLLSSVVRSGRPLSITVFLAAAENGLATAGGGGGRAGKAAAARSPARSFATCDSAVGGQIAERKEERPRE